MNDKGNKHDSGLDEEGKDDLSIKEETKIQKRKMNFMIQWMIVWLGVALAKNVIKYMLWWKLSVQPKRVVENSNVDESTVQEDTEHDMQHNTADTKLCCESWIDVIKSNMLKNEYGLHEIVVNNTIGGYST